MGTTLGGIAVVSTSSRGRPQTGSMQWTALTDNVGGLCDIYGSGCCCRRSPQTMLRAADEITAGPVRRRVYFPPLMSLTTALI